MQRVTHTNIVRFEEEKALNLESGTRLAQFEIGYETYGTLNAQRSNAILVCHALTGDQYAASHHPLTGEAGWWEKMIGPRKVLDTEKYFIICSNVLGGCMGSTGPKSMNPETGQPYALDFPMVTIGDMVNAQTRLIDHLGIETLLCVIGGSAGGMQVLEWAVRHTDRVFSAIPIATAAQESARNIACHEVCRQAIMMDPAWHGGRYEDKGTIPEGGLGVARMSAHINYLSADRFQEKFGRSLQDRDLRTFGFSADFQVESYLRYQGRKFVDRFDANSYLYLTKAIDYFDLPAAFNGQLENAFLDTKTRFCLISFSSDWLHPTESSKKIVRALHSVTGDVSFVEIDTENGHDAFLLHEPEMFAVITGFLQSTAAKRGLT